MNNNIMLIYNVKYTDKTILIYILDTTTDN